MAGLEVHQLGHVVAEAGLGEAPGVLAGDAGEHHEAGGDQAGLAGQGQGGSQDGLALRGNWRAPGQTVGGISDNVLLERRIIARLEHYLIWD